MDEDLQPGVDESLDRLIGDWWILQLRGGHRFSTDDLVTAWRAALAHPRARRLLDLGSGIGSVGLLTLHRLGPQGRTLVGVEAQAVSAGLARRTVAINALGDRVRVVHGDLRDLDVIEPVSTFDLVTGSPPYIPLGHGHVSPHPQRAGARMELRGSVYDYCAAARRWLAPGGRFCFVMAAGDPRAEDAPLRHGLRVLERWDYTFRQGKPPTIATLVCAREEDVPAGPRVRGGLAIRDAQGVFTTEYQAFRSQMGLITLE